MSSGPDGCLPTVSWCSLTKASRDMREAFVCASLGQCRSDGAPPTRSEQAAGTSPRGGLEGPQPLQRQQNIWPASAGSHPAGGAAKSRPQDCNRIRRLCRRGGSFSALRKTFLTRGNGREAGAASRPVTECKTQQSGPQATLLTRLVRAALPPLCREGRSRPGASAEWTPVPGASRRRESPRIPRPPCPRPWQSAVPAARS